jgi:hypothetical protein
MPCVTRQFDPAAGPVLHVFLSPPLQGGPPRESAMVPAWALIDTGASHSGVTAELAGLARLPEFAPVAARTPAGTLVRRAFAGAILIPEKDRGARPQGQMMMFPGDIPLAEVDSHGEEWHLLIGRDLLRHCYFGFTGYAEQFTLCF